MIEFLEAKQSIDFPSETSDLLRLHSKMVLRFLSRFWDYFLFVIFTVMYANISFLQLSNYMDNYINYFIKESVSRIRLKQGCSPSDLNADRRKLICSCIGLYIQNKLKRISIKENLNESVQSASSQQSTYSSWRYIEWQFRYLYIKIFILKSVLFASIVYVRQFDENSSCVCSVD